MKNKQPEKVYLQQPAEMYLKSLRIAHIHLKTSITRKVQGRWITFPVEDNKGWSDLIIFLPNTQTIFVEFKWGKNKMQKCQVDKKVILEKLGFEYYVIYDIDVFIELIKSKINGG